ncbi:HAMP domain-containing protein [Taklimakanibacter deserti]|uniref:HAMP domain-containing protein n=1 Tax=Taklimakanibacter deserti TaxID=2267839 RepID=UPI000E6555EC
MRSGNFSVRLPAHSSGIGGRIAETFNDICATNQSIAQQLEKVGTVVGKEGRTRQRVNFGLSHGAWGEMEASVNSLIDDLLWPTAEVTRAVAAVAQGNLLHTVRLDVDGRPLKGEFLRSASMVNTMIKQLAVFTSEVTRVAREVGTEGKLGGQAQVPEVTGVWKELTESVNQMADNLTAQVRNISDVTIAVASGDLSKKITVDVRGEILQLKEAINTMVDQLRSFASEVTRVAREVGTDGKLGGQAMVPGVAGTWKDLTDSVNAMCGNLTDQVRNIAQVTTAVARGDLSRKITVDVRGEILELKDTINTMVDQLNAFASEVTRVAREVGTEGKLGGQAQVPGVAGTWKDLTDNVNFMASNLTAQVRNIAEVSTAIAGGNLSKKITVNVSGEILQLKETINTMVDQLNAFAGEVTRVAREVGTDGKLGGQAMVPGVAGTWKDLTDSVNSMASNLTAQVRNIAEVTTAVARGDLSRKIAVDVKGEILELKNTINTMVDQLNGFASEVTRVAREVGTDGKLGGQAAVPGVAGTWKDLTDSVNSMASNLTAQVRNIAEVATAIAGGDLSKKITVDVRGEILLLKETLNTMVEQLRSFAAEVTRVAREVGTDGKLGGQAQVPGVAGTWKDLTDNVNLLAANLTTQVRNIAEVTTAVARGDLSRKITVPVQGEILELKNTINTMVDQLNAFASEVTRVAREVGTEGKLGGQATVPGVGGTWKDLTDTVNLMAANLTEQVRGIVKVVTAVADGDLGQNLTVKSKGEVAALAETINNMTATLAIFADQVTSVAREVGVDGRLGGQANVPGAAGTWKDLTGNVNLLAANLTTQVRAIAEVATAVTKGDLTRSIQVEARGEVAELKDNINTMIGNLRLTTDRNTEQDWLKTNLASFTNMLQGQRDLATVGRLLLSELAPLVHAQMGALYQMQETETPQLRLLAVYADNIGEGHPDYVPVGKGLIGQCAADKRPILVKKLPSDSMPIGSAVFKATPRNVMVLPILFENRVKAVIELASLSKFTALQRAFLETLTDSIGIVLNSIEATMQTEGLLKQSQQLASELQTQQKELQQTNEQLGMKAQQLAERNVDVEKKNQEIEQARRALEDKATELALTSKYKSEFLANMSHELRTPLNSILILAQQMSENPDGNLTPKQVEFARTIRGAGSDLQNLINDILDLSKIESGTVTVEAEELFVDKIVEVVGRPFRHEADSRQLSFKITVDPGIEGTLFTDSKRLQQILKNLLSNAFKFTERGGVTLRAFAAKGGWNPENRVLGEASSVIGFEVSDTGIGIPSDKQKLIFEAFQQADASTSRRYGGTGLGLAISRELATLLGGEIQVHSIIGTGSTFTLYLTQRFSGTPMTLAKADMDMAHAKPGAFSARTVAPLLDDRLLLKPGDNILLVVEDDPGYAGIVMDVARKRGFKAILAATGAEAIELASQYQPTAITLDIFLPDMLGWGVLSHLKKNPLTRHIPVQIVSLDEDRQHGLAKGAFSFLAKPASSTDLEMALARLQHCAAARQKRLLIVEDNPAEQLSIATLLQHDDIEVATAATGSAALDKLAQEPWDCMVLDLKLPDMSGFDVLEHVAAEENLSDLPVVVFTGRPLSPEEEDKLKSMARSIVVKGVESPERLFDETSLFMHRVVGDLPPRQRDMIYRLHDSNEDLVGRTVLVVDDDARNIFALSSVLERSGMKVLTAGNGRDALRIVEDTPDLAIILIDIMMPEMDGYEVIETIRDQPDLRRLPIIALTAKAMKGDREKCLEAGASDYLAKPVDTDQLIAALRVWLHR